MFTMSKLCHSKRGSTDQFFLLYEMMLIMIVVGALFTYVSTLVDNEAYEKQYVAHELSSLIDTISSSPTSVSYLFQYDKPYDYQFATNLVSVRALDSPIAQYTNHYQYSGLLFEPLNDNTFHITKNGHRLVEASDLHSPFIPLRSSVDIPVEVLDKQLHAQLVPLSNVNLLSYSDQSRTCSLTTNTLISILYYDKNYILISYANSSFLPLASTLSYYASELFDAIDISQILIDEDYSNIPELCISPTSGIIIQLPNSAFNNADQSLIQLLRKLLEYAL